MDGDVEQVVDGWSRGEPGGPDYEEVQIVQVGGRLRARLVLGGGVHDLKATNPSHAIQSATRLMLRDWRRFPPSRLTAVPSQRAGSRMVR